MRRSSFVNWLFCLTVIVVQSIYAQEPAVTTATAETATGEPSTNATPPAEPITSSPNQPVAERLAGQQRQLLHDLKGPPDALWLAVDEKQVLAFWQSDRSGKPLGAVLMLHDRGENPRRAATLRRMHEYLPIHGWATFSVELPELPGATVPPRPATSVVQPASPGEAPAETNPSETSASVDESDVVHQESDEGSSAKSFDNPPVATAPTPDREEVIEDIHKHIEAATAYLHEQGQYNLVLLAEGSSAYWALQHLDKAVPPPAVESADKKSKGIIERAFRAVVLVNAGAPEGEEQKLLSDALNHPDIPTFDVFTDFYLETLNNAEERRQVAKQKGYENYIVRRLPPANGATPESTETLLTKAIRGFLQKYAQGVELK